MIQVVCVKWGTRYGAADVNRLMRAVAAHATEAVRYVCVTDRPDDAYDANIVLKPFPDFALPFEHMKSGCRLKLSVFAPGLLSPDDPTIFLDLDTMVRSDIARIAEQLRRRPALYMLQNHYVPFWRVQKQLRPILRDRYYFGNSSILAFFPRAFGYIFADFNTLAAAQSGVLPKHLVSDERFMSYAARDRLRVFPHRLAVKFAEEFMTPWPFLEALRRRLPWVRARRRGLVAITFVGPTLKPGQLAAMKSGDLVRYKRLRLRWTDEAISDYWRSP
ncbi:MAG: hypothetical protein AB7O56_01045 [Bauldia sp.]